jgi:probable HAF family extracellular repeat protein
LLIAVGQPAVSDPVYEIADLGPVSWPFWPPINRFTAINDLGQVVGPFDGGDIWENGVLTDLDLPGPLCDINNAGQMIGNYQVFVEPGIIEQRGYIYQDGVWTDIEIGLVNALNNAGQVVGGQWLWDGGDVTDLGSLGGGGTWASGLDDAGRVVGWSGVRSGPFRTVHAFLWEDGVMTDLGTLGGEYSFAYDINNVGQIVGRAANEMGYQDAFFWEDGEMIPIEDTVANSINDLGQVVGWGFLWEAGTRHWLSDIIPPDNGWSNLIGHDINNPGQIVGTGVLDGNLHGFLMTLIPEPASLLLFAVALAVLARHRRA